MAGREHRYRVSVRWTGNQGQGTTDYRSYSRSHEIASPANPDKAVIAGSSDPAFRGDPARWNPEELYVAALSACHKLWYLHLCAVAGVVVESYVDEAEGIMVEGEDGSGRFASVTLRPHITVTRSADIEKAQALHHEAHAKCFIANSVNTPVSIEAVISASKSPAG
jgi:organic hydroperoxide reductase OsmC/OhrA